jgi:hypothetical protein
MLRYDIMFCIMLLVLEGDGYAVCKVKVWILMGYVSGAFEKFDVS